MKIMTVPVGMLQTNCYIVCDGTVCAVIDPGANAEKIMENIRSCGCSPAAILLTHAHFDHTGALQALHGQYPDVPVYVHAADSDNEKNMSHGKLIYTHTYAEGDVINVGTLSFAVCSTPGHTPGSVCLRCENALFSGDTLFAGACGRTDFEGGSMMQMMTSLKRLSSLEGDLAVYPGHGESTSLDAERRYNPYLREAMCR